MINSAKTVNIKLTDAPVDCYYPEFKKNKSLAYKYYRTFSFNDDLYTVDDYAVVIGDGDIEVVKLICIFTNHEKKVHLVTRKYILARNLTDILVDRGCIKFDDNEVVEDLRKHYVISADKILRKCCLVLAEENENCIISRSNLNKLSYFSCRFTLTLACIFPILSIPATQVILSKYSFTSSCGKSSSNSKQKCENETICLDSSSDENTPEKMISQKNNTAVLKSLPDNCSPIHRNSVRRNLNKSFGDSPNKTNRSILNYSIVTDEEMDDSLILKLRISEKNRLPLATLKGYINDDYALRLRSNPNRKVRQAPPVRKSSRIIVRKSYADYISPVKSTPRKRVVSSSSSDSEEGSCSESNTKESAKGYRSKKVEEVLEKALPRNEDSVLGKRSVRTPKRYVDSEIGSPCLKKFSSQGSARRSLRLTSTETEDGAVAQRNLRTNKRRKSPSLDRAGVTRTPEKKANLDESMRRSVLKVKLYKAELENEAKTLTRSTPKSRPSRRFFYETSSDSGESNVENRTGKAKNNARSRRIRPKSTAVPNNEDSDSDVSTPRTPKRRGRGDDSGQTVPKTPRNRNNAKTPKSSVRKSPKTPRNRAKLIRDGVITPSMLSRSKAVSGDRTPLMTARSQLHVSYVPTALPCREKEYTDVFSFLEGKLLDGCGGCMYISGVPGTGKTATVTSVINNLLDNDDVPKFSYVCVNGMRLTEPRQSYVEILKQLIGKTVSWEQAQSLLEERFTKSKKSSPVVMLIDELDVLCTRRQDVVYNLLDWPTKAKNQLIVITIANTMDLPERLLMSRVTSRLGLTRLTFQAYTHKQLQEIVTKRLFGTDSFNPDAIQLVARKVASVSGDARRALDICRRAAEIAEAEGEDQLVNMNHVNEALNAMITQPKVRAIKNCSRLEQLVLKSIVAEVERTGVEETTFVDVFKMLVSCAAIDGFRMVSGTVALSAVCRLSACRLILTDQKCSDIYQRIILNVSVDDVYYALKK